MPLYEAEIVVEVDKRTMDVFTVKVALVAPAGTVTLEGTLAAPLLLESSDLLPKIHAEVYMIFAFCGEEGACRKGSIAKWR